MKATFRIFIPAKKKSYSSSQGTKRLKATGADRDSHGGFVAEFTVEGSFRLNAVRQHASTARVTNSGDSTVLHDGTRELASGGS